MEEKKKKSLSFIKSEWQGREVSHRIDRVNIKLQVNLRNPDEKLIKSRAEELLRSIKGAEIVRLSVRTGKLIVKVPEGTDIVALAKELSQRSEVAYAEPDIMDEGFLAPNDTRYGDQWALAKINAEGAWDLETGGSNVLIGILDSGISIQNSSLSHSDLDDTSRFILGTDFVEDDATPNDEFGHGTHVTGTAAAETNNADGIAGINWNSQVYICRVLDENNHGSSSDFEAAVEEIVDYAVAHNLSAVLNYSAGGGDSQTKIDACQYVEDHGMLLCAAAGNDHGGAITSPALHAAGFSCVTAVGATDSGDAVADFSNVGPELTVVAPGVDILSTFPTYDVNGDTAHDFVKWQGTSMATPHVTSLASLVWSHEPRLTSEQVRDVIINTAVKLGPGDFDNSWGHGRIDAAEAVAKAGWEISPVQLNLNFIDIPEGETQLRAIRFDVKSFHAISFEMATLPGAPFTMHNYAPPVTPGKSTDYDTPREVHLWVKYTGTTAGDTASGIGQVRCLTTGELFDVTITANTIARPTCAMMLVLDKSGSMLDQSGVTGQTREQILRYSANIFMNYVRQNNGVGIVTFDQDAADLLNPVAGPFGAPDDPFDPTRASATAALSLYAANPAGLTAIGDGIERGHNNLAPVTGYDKKAIVVFTDGHETASQYIRDVASLINEQVFAVGLGTAQELDPQALFEICNNHNGYLLLTDQLDSDDTFKLAKYFLQIQAGVNNEQIVVDPNGYVAPGQTVRVPFDLSEADISADAIVLLPFQGLLDVAVETPEGNLIDSGNVGSFPTVTRVLGPNITYYRLTLPVSDGAAVNSQIGKWHLILRVNTIYFKRFLAMLEKNPRPYQAVQAHGVQFTALVQAYSNVRMNCQLAQNSYEPGARLSVRSLITEYGVPLEKNASVRGNLTLPDGSSANIGFNKVSAGVYETQVIAYYPGIYRFGVHASGFTTRNVPFTRQQVLTGAVWRGGDNPPPTSTNNPDYNPVTEAICKFLNCLRKSVDRNRLQKAGLELDKLMACYCKKGRPLD